MTPADFGVNVRWGNAASRALGDLLPVVPPKVSPDCVVEKCRACSGDAWDDERDAPARCDHHCHGAAS